jgi:F0F1-type ATP synthase membrane subunit b/b'
MQETQSRDVDELVKAAEEAGALVREQIQSILETAEARAAEIESNAQREAERVRREASDQASDRAQSIVQSAEVRAEKIRMEAERVRREASESASRVFDRASARLLKHAQAVEREMEGLLTGLRRDAESLSAGLDSDAGG